MKWSLERHYAKEEKRMHSKNGRLGAAVAKINKSVVAVTCEVCEKPCGFVETAALATLKASPAAYCSKLCIRNAAEAIVEDTPKAERLRVRLTTKGQKKIEKCDVLSCTRTEKHTHCSECGSVDHGAAFCDNMG